MAPQVEESWVQSKDIRLRYTAAGAGSPVVLLHGVGESRKDWSWVLPALAQEHRVYALDLPGSGDSDKPAGDYSVDYYCRQVEGALDALCLDQAALVGHSLGGLTALSLALSRPRRVTSLALLDSAGLGPEISPALLPMTLPAVGDWLNACSRTATGAVQRAWGRALLQFASLSRVPFAWFTEQVRLAGLPGLLEATLAAARSHTGFWGQRIILLNELQRLIKPVLIIWGKLDKVLPVTQAWAAARRLGQGKAVIIPNCGHLPHVECPGEVTAALVPFLAKYAA